MEELESTEVLSSEVALMALTKGEIDIQIATAKAHPRSVKEFLDTATELVTVDEDTAASMWYSLPARKGGDGKKIEGPSVRMAEVVAYSWMNLRAETNIESIDEKYVTAVGTVFDIQRNVAIRQRVKRRITDRNGKRYSEDMIVNVCNSASSIAFREAVFKAVPRTFVKHLYEKARAVAIGTQATLSDRRMKAFEWFESQGIAPKIILRKFNRKSILEITLDDLAELTGIRTAVRDGDISLQEAFAEEVTDATSEALTETVMAAAKKPPRDMNQGGVHPAVKETVGVQTEIK